MKARPTRPLASSAATALALALLASFGAALVAYALGWIGPGSARREPPPGTAAVPVAARPLAAYTEVRLQHLIAPGSGAIDVIHLDESALLPDTIRDPEQILGRVLATDKPVGLVFSRSDFLPEGTRPGLVAGIPPGKRALRIDAARVSGLVGLNRGDRFDLVESQSVPRSPAAGARGLPSVASRGVARVIVESGSVVLPLASRAAPGAGAAVQEMVVAVTPEEVTRLTESLASGARLDCVPRSGRPGDAAVAASRRPDATSIVETITGAERRTVSVPSSLPAN